MVVLPRVLPAFFASSTEVRGGPILPICASPLPIHLLSMYISAPGASAVIFVVAQDTKNPKARKRIKKDEKVLFSKIKFQI